MRSSSECRGSTSARGIHAAATSSSSVQVPTAIPARNAAPRVVASSTGDTSIGRPQASARAWVKTGFAVMPPSTRRVSMGSPESVSADSSRSAPRWAMPSSTARTSSGRPLPRVSPVNVPRAPKSQTGVPRPRRAGTNQTSPVSSQAAATVAEWAASSMIRRSSRSHSMQVPAESMMASSPQVTRPFRRQAMIGMVPAGPRTSWGGRVGPTHWSSMPPVPKVALARPAVVQLWPMREACWSPAIPAIGGAPASVDAWPTMPEESTIPGRTAAGMRRADSRCSLQPSPSPWMRPVTPALEASVTWSAPSDRTQATHVSMVPKASSPRSARERSGSTWSRMAASLVADAFGATRMPWAWSSRQVPTVRRSCHPSPGATGTPVARSHTRVEARWLAIPTASTGPPSARLRVATSRTAAAMASPSNSTSPGKGESGSTGTWWMCSTVASGRTTAPRTPEVPTSTTRMLMARAPVRSRWAGRACPD